MVAYYENPTKEAAPISFLLEFLCRRPFHDAEGSSNLTYYDRVLLLWFCLGPVSIVLPRWVSSCSACFCFLANGWPVYSIRRSAGVPVWTALSLECIPLGRSFCSLICMFVAYDPAVGWYFVYVNRLLAVSD